jgi:hypothetical protein
MEQMNPTDLCDVCGGEVAADEAVRAELMAGELMCPTPMVFHPACHQRAAEMWQPDPESSCVVDTEFPEAMQWPRAGAPQS